MRIQDYSLSRRSFLALGASALSGCSRSLHTVKSPDQAPPPFQYEEISSQAGLRYAWRVPGPRPLNILETIGNGCAFLDFNRDGNLDILLVGPKPALFLGDGNGRFTDVTKEVGLHLLQGHFLGCAVGDFDNDGYPDIYLTAYRGGVLLHNEKGKNLINVSHDAGIPPQPWGTSAAWVQLDPASPHLDLIVGNYVQFGPHHGPNLCNFNGVLGGCGPRYYSPIFPVLFKNRGGGAFQYEPLPRTALSGKTLGIACADFNQTGRQSIALANDEMPANLLIQRAHGFQDEAASAGMALNAQGRSYAGMGVDWGDYDNDGWLDLVVGTFDHEPKSVFHNQNGSFTDVSMPLGIGEKTLPYITFGCKWLDADNDGWLDLVLANGHVQDTIAQVDHALSYREPTLFFHNQQGTHFQEVSGIASTAFTRPIVGRGLAVGDFDNDGRLDVLIVDSEGTPLLMHNTTRNQNHWFRAKLKGVHSNLDGLGALLTLTAGDKTLLRHCATDGSYMSASDARVHFGLGSYQGPLTLQVRWPSGVKTTHHNLKPDAETLIAEQA